MTDPFQQRPPALVLIEDDPHVTVLLRHHFERAGWSIRSCPSVACARELLQSEWDLVVLDRGLPDGDGVTLCREIRAAHPHGYVLMLTGDSSDEAKIEAFAVGADDYVTKPFQMDELLARIRAALRIVALQKALLESNHRLEELSMTDSLTSLRNRRAFDEQLRTAFAHSARYERALSLAVIDVDHFKSINDTRGHQAGDAVLRSIAAVLRRLTRGTDFLARVGGEEFAVVLPETQLLEATRFAEKVRAAVDLEVGATISIGIASMPHSIVTDACELYQLADGALYRAKANGRNRVEIERRKQRGARVPAATLPRSDQPSQQQ